MARKSTKKPKVGPSPHLRYMSALQDIADQTQQQLARLMPHHGERGRLTEDIVRNVLSRTLPKRFSLGTGVVISAHGDVSRQTDIVIYDNFYNAPLVLESGVCLFPAEIVFATIEVKSVLTPDELRSSMDAIVQMRKVCSQKKYIIPVTVRTPDGGAGLQLVRLTEVVPARNYIVAFAQKGLGPSYKDFCDKLCKCLNEDESHVHGVCVLQKNWFAGRVANKSPAQLFGGEGNGLLNLYTHILKAQQNFAVHTIDLDAYLPQPT